MKRVRILPLALGAALGAGCGSAAPPATPPPTPITNEATPPPAADTTKAPATPDTSATSPAKVSEQPPAVAERSQACEGTAIDLNWWLKNTKACRNGTLHKVEIPGDGITARIEPVSVRARAGQAVSVDYVLQNETAASLTLWPDYCDMAFLEPEILDSDGKPVAQCGGGGGCGGSPARLTLDARGTARLRFDSVKTDTDTLCLDQPLPSDAYTLLIRGRGGLPDATGILVIE